MWLEAIREAEARGHRALTARPAESEASLSYVALADLVADVFDDAESRLPPPQAKALATALLRDEPDERADPRTTSAGLVSLLTALAAEAPLVIAVDDVHWLDRASSRALEYALRRLPPRTGVVLTRRTDGSEPPPLRVDRAVPEDRLVRCVPAPLSVGALRRLIEGRLGEVPPRARLARILEASGGNPFFALEIARAVGAGDPHTALADPLPLPSSLQELVSARLPDLPGPVLELLLVVSALPRPTIAKVEDAVGSSLDVTEALRVAEDGRVLRAERDRLRFTHPLLSSAVYASASSSRRRAVHRRLAQVAVDPEERARHLAAAATGPDEPTASEIEDGATAAALRGAQDASAELFEEACRLTPPEHTEELVRRMLGQATALHETGDGRRARTLAERAVGDARTPASRLRAVILVTRLEWDAGVIAFERLDHALDAAKDDRDLERDVCIEWLGVMRTVDPRRALEFAERAQPLLAGDIGVDRADFLLDRFWAEVLLGRSPNLERFARGIELEAAKGPEWPIPILWFTATDDFDAARARHEIEDAWWRDRGDDRMRGDRLAYRAVVELRAGRWDLAEELADQSCALVEGFDVGRAHAVAFGWRALVDACRGRLDRARSTLLHLLDEAQRTGARTWWVERLFAILGFVELSAGDHEAADRAFVEMRAAYDSMGIMEPLLDWSEPFHIESLLALGHLERANECLERLEERGRCFPRLWIDVSLPRARALVLAAEGDVQAALAAIGSLDRESASRLPFELARGLLTHGQLLRRAKQRRAAAIALSDALEIFEALDAPVWVERTRAELARVVPRRRAPDELTETERLVAELAATGLTNRDVAKAAFVSTKTVEANLARVYRKLGIRSRAELGARMRDQASTAKTET